MGTSLTTTQPAPDAPVAVGQPAQSATPTRLALLRPVAAVAEILQQQVEVRQFMKQALQEGRDYGKVPGVEKPSLLKPGAERINSAHGVVARFRVAEREVDHDRVTPWKKRKKVWVRNEWHGEWEETVGESLGLYRYVVECELVHRESGVVVAQCLGACSTMESKYIDRPRDCENTALKMAEKRALVGATLLCYGLSDEFTQDVEDTGLAAATGEASDDDSASGGPPKVEPPVCPVHNVPMRDDRQSKRNPKAPDWKCSKKNADNTWCNQVKWPGQWPPSDATKAEDREPGNGSGRATEPSTAEQEGARPTTAEPTTSGKRSTETHSATTNPSAADSLSGAAPSATTPTAPATRSTPIDFGSPSSILRGLTLRECKEASVKWLAEDLARRAPAHWHDAIREELTSRDVDTACRLFGDEVAVALHEKLTERAEREALAFDM